MATFTRCTECGMCIGAFSDFVNKARELLYKLDDQYKDVAIDKVFFNPNIVPNMEIIFDAIPIKNRCCRIHLMTGVNFDNVS